MDQASINLRGTILQSTYSTYFTIVNISNEPAVSMYEYIHLANIKAEAKFTKMLILSSKVCTAGLNKLLDHDQRPTRPPLGQIKINFHVQILH